MKTYIGVCSVCGKAVTVVSEFKGGADFTCNMDDGNPVHHTRKELRENWLNGTKTAPQPQPSV